MKLSKLMHIGSVAVGLVGVVAFAWTLIGGGNVVFGITKMDALVCTVIVMLIAIWLQVGTIHHMMLEKRGEIV